MCAPASDVTTWSAILGAAGVLAGFAAVVMMWIDRRRSAGRIVLSAFGGYTAAELAEMPGGWSPPVGWPR